jgi:hypothetical protein
LAPVEAAFDLVAVAVGDRVERPGRSPREPRRLRFAIWSWGSGMTVVMCSARHALRPDRED